MQSLQFGRFNRIIYIPSGTPIPPPNKEGDVYRYTRRYISPKDGAKDTYEKTVVPLAKKLNSGMPPLLRDSVTVEACFPSNTITVRAFVGSNPSDIQAALLRAGAEPNGKNSYTLDHIPISLQVPGKAVTLLHKILSKVIGNG